MESAQKPESMARTMRSKPTLQLDGLSRVQPSGETYTIDDWIQDHPEQFPDVDGGIVKELMTLALRYIEKFELDAVKHKSVLSVLEDHRLKMVLWIDGDRNLDRRLAEDPKTRESFVSNLVALVIGLKTGINLVTPETRHSLLEDTNRVIEQASKIAPLHIQRSAGSVTNSVIEFLDAKNVEITSRIENVSELLFTTRYLGGSFDEEPSPQVEETPPDGRRPFGPDELLTVVHPQSKQSHPNLTFMVASSSASRNVENSGRPNSEPSKSSSKHSSRSTKSPSISPDFSDNGSHTRPSTNTCTSMSLLEATSSFSETATSTPTRLSTICRNCGDILDESEQFTKINNLQRVKILHPGRGIFVEKRMLIDTGCDDNIISHSVVEELGLSLTKLTPQTLRCFNDNDVQVKEAVLPEWHFSGSSKMRSEFRFWVVDNLPRGIDILAGNKARNSMNVHLCVNGALVAFGDPEDVITEEQSELQRRRQDHDNIKTDNDTRHAIEATFAEEVKRNQAVPKASTHTKSQNSTSRRDPGDSADAQ